MTAALVLPVAAIAGNGDKATGGGQILFSTDGGAGNTIAFTAQGTAEAAKGQVQFIDRSAGSGGDQVKEHGEVACIIVDGTVAKVAGTLRDGGPFNLYVVDNGQGQAENDAIFFDTMAEDPTCDFDDPDEDQLEALARGNAQVTDGDAAARRKKRSKKIRVRTSAPTLTYAKALQIAGLR